MRKIVALFAVVVVAVVLMAAPSGAVKAGQFCKKVELGLVVTADNGAWVRCSYVNGFYRWVATSSPPPTTTTTRPPSTPTTTVVPRVPTQSQKDSVLRLYWAYFLRDPDASGLNYWATILAGGRPLAAISEQFAKSSEFQRRYGSLTNAQFVDLIYDNLFDRNPDPAGAAYWTGALNKGRTRGAVMIGFSESAEFRRITGTT